MKQKTICGSFVALCLVLCAVLLRGMLLFGPSHSAANERQAPLPRLRTEEGFNAAYLSELADYLGEHFFLRYELLTLRSRVFSALGSAAVEDVIPGADGWLYYAPTLRDYAGLSPLDDAALDRMAENLRLMQEYCEGQGMRFLFAIAPNKNSLYPDAMPDTLPVAAEHDAQRLMRRPEAQNIPYADLFAAFHAQPETLYFAHDSHWNSKGAALAADAINASFGRASDYFSDPFNAGAEAHSGDLYQMLYPAGTDPETDPLRASPLSYQRKGNETRPDSITIQTESDGQGSLFAFRDSFGNLLYPYLADSFADARFSRSSAYNLAQAAGSGADYVLIELVERNLPDLLEYVPVMPAPRRELSAAEAEGTPVTLRVDDGASGLKEHRLIRGTLPDAKQAGRVYLDCGGAVYEAFLQSDGGFAAYLPAAETPICALYETGGALHAAPAEFLNETN